MKMFSGEGFPSKKKTILEEKKKETKFSAVESPSSKRIVDLDSLKSLESLKGKIVCFQKVNFGDYEDFKLFSKGENEEFSSHFYLHQDHTRSIKKQSPIIPMYIQGTVTSASVVKGGLRYHLQDGASFVVLKVEPL
jgi:hypothetical protein